jgi:4'-phosphopantetheinyl transferase
LIRTKRFEILKTDARVRELPVAGKLPALVFSGGRVIPDKVPLNDKELGAWIARLDLAPAQVEYFATLLSTDETSRATRFHFENHRRRFIVARGTLRVLLGVHLDLPPAAVAINYGPTGKPHVAGHVPDIYFNVSHSGERALYAISRSRPVGVDIEFLTRNVDYNALSKRFFTPTELAALECCEEPTRKTASLALWTRKEAIAKANGTGLPQVLAELDATAGNGLLELDSEEIFIRNETSSWRVHTPAIEGDYIAAIARAVFED